MGIETIDFCGLDVRIDFDYWIEITNVNGLNYKPIMDLVLPAYDSFGEFLERLETFFKFF